MARIVYTKLEQLAIARGYAQILSREFNTHPKHLSTADLLERGVVTSFWDEVVSLAVAPNRRRANRPNGRTQIWGWLKPAFEQVLGEIRQEAKDGKEMVPTNVEGVSTGRVSSIEPVCSNTPKADNLHSYTFALRSNQSVAFYLPSDLTLAEAKRLGFFMLTLVQEPSAQELETQVLDFVTTPPEQARQALRPPKCKIGIVGLLPDQAAILQEEYKTKFDMSFWKDGDIRSLKAMAKNCDHMILHIRHTSHSTDKFLTSHSYRLHRVGGGVSSIRFVLNNLVH